LFQLIQNVPQRTIIYKRRKVIVIKVLGNRTSGTRTDLEEPHEMIHAGSRMLMIDIAAIWNVFIVIWMRLAVLMVEFLVQNVHILLWMMFQGMQNQI